MQDTIECPFIFVPDGDTASLVSLLTTSLQQLNTLNEQLGAVKKTYAETKKYVGYVEDSANAFDRLAHFDASRATNMLEDAVPNLRYFDRESHHLGSWTQGRHELDVMMSACLRSRVRQADAQAQGQAYNDKIAQGLPVPPGGPPPMPLGSGYDPCADLDRQLSGEQAARTIVDTFGPPRTVRAARIDAIVADALNDAVALQLLDKTLQEQWLSYEKYCLEALADAVAPGDITDAVMSRCQAAGAVVQVTGARQLQMLRRELSRLKEIEAWRMAAENGKRKEEQGARSREKDQLIEGAAGMKPPEIRITGPGFNLLEGK